MKMNIFYALLISCLVFNSEITAEEEVDTEVLKCEVCKVTLKELEKELSKVDPKRKIQVGSSKIDHTGNEVVKTVPMRQSEVFISDKIDSVCNSMENYVRVKDKVSGELKVVSLTDAAGGMNSLLSDYDFITDSDMNKSVKYYCERFVEEYEDDIIEVLKKGVKDAKYAICTQTTSMCFDEPDEADEEEEPYIDEAHTEL